MTCKGNEKDTLRNFRMTSNKQEYFETTEIQKKIRQGFSELRTGKITVPNYSTNVVVGPILNESWIG